MTHKIHKIAIISDDIEGAVEFYTKKLGLTVMERFANEREAFSDPDMWELSADLVEMGEMPPRNKRRQPTGDERKQIIAWINGLAKPNMGPTKI